MTASGAGLCFLVAGVGIAGILVAASDAFSEPHPLDLLRVASALIVLGILGGAVVFVRLGLWIAEGIRPRARSLPVHYAVTLLFIAGVAAISLLLIPVTLVAWAIVATVGPLLELVLTRTCVGCIQARMGPPGLAAGPVFCARHDRFFGGDGYRLLLSRDVD
jgi:hypothetical protein